jgi:hypothetical protein
MKGLSLMHFEKVFLSSSNSIIYSRATTKTYLYPRNNYSEACSNSAAKQSYPLGRVPYQLDQIARSTIAPRKAPFYIYLRLLPLNRPKLLFRVHNHHQQCTLFTETPIAAAPRKAAAEAIRVEAVEVEGEVTAEAVTVEAAAVGEAAALEEVAVRERAVPALAVAVVKGRERVIAEETHGRGTPWSERLDPKTSVSAS